MQRPLKDLAGQIPSASFAFIKQQAAARFIDMLRTPELAGSINAYMIDALGRLQPRPLRELLETINPDSAERVKVFLTNSLLTVLGRDDTARTINSLLSSQIDKFLVAPIGRLADHMPAGAIEKASSALTEKIVLAAR
jgi:hypothetical protein